MRCENFNLSANRCSREACFEVLRSGVRGSRWRAVCAECADILRRRASAYDKLKIRPLQVTDEDEHHRRRVYLAGHDD